MVSSKYVCIYEYHKIDSVVRVCVCVHVCVHVYVITMKEEVMDLRGRGEARDVGREEL